MRSATAIVDRFMLADGMDGMTEASATDRSSTCGRTAGPPMRYRVSSFARRVTGGQDGRPTATVVRSSPCRKWQCRCGRCEGQIWSCGLSPRPDARRDPARRSGPVPGSRRAAGAGRTVAEGSGDDPLVRYLWSPATRTLVPACGHPRREEPRLTLVPGGRLASPDCPPNRLAGVGTRWAAQREPDDGPHGRRPDRRSWFCHSDFVTGRVAALGRPVDATTVSGAHVVDGGGPAANSGHAGLHQPRSAGSAPDWPTTAGYAKPPNRTAELSRPGGWSRSGVG